jgi:methyl-accepting chemotaxis protein
MVVDDTIAQALTRIADAIEENGETLKRIADHYDGVVPVMTRNAKRAEEQGKAIDEEMENSFGEKVRNIFSPQEH